MRRIFAAALLLAACRHLPYVADGRLPAAALAARYRTLGWVEETVFAYPGGPSILGWRTPKAGRAVWLLAGIHGEEPAGPNAIARALKALELLAAEGVPIVLLPLCNPKAYAANQRYPNTPERDWKKGGYSVGDSEYLLPDPKEPERARAAAPPGPETAALTAWALETAERYPPALVVDLHEDELSKEGGYLYSQGGRGAEDPAAREIVRLLRSSNIPLRTIGQTRFGEPIVAGVISRGADGGSLRDGSIDELLSASALIRAGRSVPGPAAPTVVVVETPAFSGARLEDRVDAQRRVVERLGELWRLSIGR